MPMTRGGGPILPRPKAPEIEVLGPLDEDEPDEAEHLRAHNEIRRTLPPWSEPWEQIAEEDGVFLLRHDGKLYAATEIAVSEVLRGRNT